MTLSAVIIGAGRIAAGFDAPGDDAVLTHAHALRLEKRSRCLGIFDRDWKIAQNAARKWGVAALRDFEEAMACAPDMVIVAVPDQDHEDYLKRISMYSPKLVLCEKPLTTSYAASKQIVETYEREGIALAVNYQRRFDTTVCQLYDQIKLGALGSPLGGVVWYSKGILHNGSHAIDLLRFLFGPVRSVQVRRKISDFLQEDPTVSGTLEFDQVQVELIGGDERNFSIFELDLVFEKGRYRFTQSGMYYERYSIQPDPIFRGYAELIVDYAGKTELTKAMANMMSALLDYLEGVRPLRNSARESLPTQYICELMAQAELNRRVSIASAGA